MRGCVFVDVQSGHIDREIPADVAASLLRMSREQMVDALKRDGEAFNERFILMADWRSDEYTSQKVPIQ